MKFEKKITLTTCDFNNYEDILPTAVLDNLQDVAAQHGEMIGVGFEEMAKRNLIWILAATKYTMYKQPKRYSVNTLITWPSKPRRIESEREYIMKDEDGVILKATSKWCLYDIKKKSIALCDPSYFNGEFLEDKNFENPYFSIIPYNKEKLEYVFTYVVRHSDIDRNQHMNNSKYAIIVYDALKNNSDIHISEFQINYVNQSFLDDKINVYKSQEQNDIYVFGTSENDQIIFKAKVTINLQVTK